MNSVSEAESSADKRHPPLRAELSLPSPRQENRVVEETYTFNTIFPSKTFKSHNLSISNTSIHGCIQKPALLLDYYYFYYLLLLLWIRWHWSFRIDPLIQAQVGLCLLWSGTSFLWCTATSARAALGRCRLTFLFEIREEDCTGWESSWLLLSAMKTSATNNV